ncbi:MAG: TAXI family TRAP transporter solute-binding subunit [Polyangiaceae bacterium]|jgi:TRAP-type uncharacterized transport system substrate-binding protein
MASGTAEVESLLSRVLDFLQSDHRVRVGLGALLVAVLLAVAGHSVYQLIPRHYTLTITGGDIVTNRHYLARLLQGEARKQNITLIVKPAEDTVSALKMVSEGKLDLAFIPGGLSTVFPNVEHVATVAPEMVHLLVKPGIQGMGDLRGRSINLGAKDSDTRDIGLTLAEFAGYAENIDYVETNYTPEQLLALPPNKMPDAIITVSSVPSYLVEILVRERHYEVMEIPFPESLALRHGWAANGQILAYTYSPSPPVPPKTIQTVAVNMHLLANAKVDPAAIEKLLEVLYGPSLASLMRQPLDESKITVSSGYPISAGMTAYLTRNESIITVESWNKLTSLFGLVMSFSGMGIVVIRWFRGKEPKPVFHDDEFHQYLVDVATVERSAFTMETSGKLDPSELRRMREQLGGLRATVIERYPRVALKDPFLFDRCVASVRASHEHVGRLLSQAEQTRGAEGAQA